MKPLFSVIPSKGWIWVSLNWLFFGVVVVGALVGQAGTAGFYRWPVGSEVFNFKASSTLLLVAGIFFFNLVLSGFALLTLSGLFFFVLPLVFLSFRAFSWGVLMNGWSTPLFLAAFPTLILEGEGYVLAASAGVNLCLSWLKPEWAYRGAGLSRSEAVKLAFRDCARIYVLVMILLLAGAVVEASTLILIF